MRSPGLAVLWETWRVTRVEAAWRVALGTAAALFAALLLPAIAPTNDPSVARNAGATLALALLVLPHFVGWLSLQRLSGGRPDFPLRLLYTRPLRTPVMVSIPLAYLAVLSAASYLVSALVLQVASGHPFPLLPVAVWIAVVNVLLFANLWSARGRTVLVLTNALIAWSLVIMVMQRLDAFADDAAWYDDPMFWPAIFDLSLAGYAVFALLGLVFLWLAIAKVSAQRHGDDTSLTARTPGAGWRSRLIDLFHLPCPTSSATRAQAWFELKSSGFALLTAGLAFAIVGSLLFAAGVPIDASINQRWPNASCPVNGCFYVRPLAVLLTLFAVLFLLAQGVNAFGIRRKQGRTWLSAFEATQPCAPAQLVVLKVLVRSACLLAALLAVGVGICICLLRYSAEVDAVLVQMWNVRISGLLRVLASLTGYEWLALAMVAATGTVLWVGALAVLGALRSRYSRRMSIAVSMLPLYGLALALLVLAERHGYVPAGFRDIILVTTRWAATAAIVGATLYLYLRCLAERTLTIRQVLGAVLLSGVFVAAWVTLLGAGVQFAGLSWMSVASKLLMPLFLPLLMGALVPWSYGRLRHL